MSQLEKMLIPIGSFYFFGSLPQICWGIRCCHL